jgi:hydroxyethylthiazole kinase
MLISPPFLPPRGNQSEEQWLQTAMQGGTPGTGAYPVSAQLDWHGGIHLTAPMNGTTAEPVRAIADGTVIFVREATRTDDPKHPLCYGGGYTSDGVVVIRHDTEIGVDARDQPVAVRFYSIYHHLSSIRPTVLRNRPIWRKDAIGQAGHIYGVPNQIHFEIRCDEENLRKLIGRTSGDVPLDRDGRMDVLYGEMYFLLPIGAPIYGERPLSNSPVARVAGRNGSPTAIQALQPVAQTAEALVVGVRYAGGQGDTGHRGDAFVTTYRLDGSTLGPPRGESEAEYKLYEDCMAISKSYPANAQPAPSAVLELLRFGRVIGPDALTPADVPHWRQITHAGGTGWANLNAANVRKYSDADFPQWKGWKLIADDVNNDARCDSPTLKSWLDADGDKNVDPIEGMAALAQDHVQKRMCKTMCKIPCEWDEASLEMRWKWLTDPQGNSLKPMNTADFSAFINHARALSITSSELRTSQWTFEPKVFINQWRACSWLSQRELASCIPRRSLSAPNLDWATASQRAQQHHTTLNRLFQKYLGHSKQRQIHLLCQIYIETGLLRTLDEGGNGHRMPYDAFYGRGYLQLTWAGNYEKYGKYQAIPNPASPTYIDHRITGLSNHKIDGGGQLMRWHPRYDPAIVSNQSHHALNSSGHYWISKTFRGTRNINRVCDLEFGPLSVAFNCWLINGGGNGYANRQQFAQFLENILLDKQPQSGTATFSYPALSPAGTPTLCQTFPPIVAEFTQTGTVHHDKQTP